MSPEVGRGVGFPIWDVKQVETGCDHWICHVGSIGSAVRVGVGSWLLATSTHREGTVLTRINGQLQRLHRS